MAQRVDHLIEGWVSAGGDGLTVEQREDFYRSLSLISSNIRTKMESEP